MAWTETASFPATRSLQGQAARTARCDTACKALGKQQGAARPLLWEKKRLGCQATAHQWKQSGDHQQQELEASHLYAKGPQQPALGTDAVLGGDGAISALTPAVTVLKDLIYQGNQRCCPPRKQLSLGRERPPAPPSLPKLLQAQQTLSNCFCPGEPDGQVGLLLSLKLPTCKLV